MIYLNGRHGDWDMKVLPIIHSFHHCDAVGALYILSRILASCYINCRDNIAGMGIEAPKGASHCWPCKVLEHVKLHQSSHTGLQHLPHNLIPNYCLAYNRLPTPFNPVHCSWLLVWTEVSWGDSKTLIQMDSNFSMHRALVELVCQLKFYRRCRWHPCQGNRFEGNPGRFGLLWRPCSYPLHRQCCSQTSCTDSSLQWRNGCLAALQICLTCKSKWNPSIYHFLMPKVKLKNYTT